MPDWLTVIILGIVEGITEFLPVSSTGHLLIAEHWLKRQSDLFNIVIQCGAVIAVLPLFPDRIKQVLTRWKEPETRDFIIKILAAFFITAAGGMVLDKLKWKLPETLMPVTIAVFVGGILFVLIETLLKKRVPHNNITWTIVIAVALGQLMAAVFPGASRSGTTILLMLMLGLGRPLATEFSFMVGIPTMMAAGGYKILKELKAMSHAPAGAPHEDWAMLLLGTVVSAIVSFIVVKWFLRFVQTHTFICFGYYRIALAIFLFTFFR